MLHAQVVFGVAQLGLASKLPLSKWLVLENLHLPDYKVGYASLSPAWRCRDYRNWCLSGSGSKFAVTGFDV